MEIFNVNGVKVVYHNIPSRLTNVQFLTNVGSCVETEEEEGLAHILEHNFFNGSVKRPNKSDISRAANDIGGGLNAYTGVDTTVYHISVLNEFFAAGFDILADMYKNPLFDEKEFVKELNPILSEFRSYEDDPDSHLSFRTLPAMYGRQAGHPVIGTEESIKAATTEKLHNFRNKYYGGNNFMISIVGGITKAEVEDVVAKLFPVAPAASLRVEKKKATFTAGELTLHKEGITEAVYSLVYPALEKDHPDRVRQSFMSYVLGGGDSSLLFERIRNDLALSCYGIYSSTYSSDPYSALEVSTSIVPEQLDQLHNEVLAQIDILVNNKIDEARFNRAKASFKTSLAAVQEKSSGYNNGIATAILKGETENPIEKWERNLAEVSIDDIQRLAQETFSVKPFKGILLPKA